jgi:segregation and condensation protein B
MVMRLVRDDDFYDGPMTLDQEEQTSRNGQGTADDEADTDGDTAGDAQLVDAQDGTAIDLLEEDNAAEGADAAVAPQVNLASLEALLLSTHHPLTAGRLAELLDLETTKPLRKAIKALNEQYASTGRCFRIEQVAGGFQILTLPEHGDLLKKFHQKEVDAKLTKAAIETLAIIAYKQPILRADVEAIRGVACGETIRSLMEKRLVKIAGRAEEPGRPILYGTTKRFLELFGLNSIKDLPQPEALLEKVANG